jgi:hypothetical protein
MKTKTLNSVFAAALLAVGFILSVSVSNASTFNLDVSVTSDSDISHVFVYTSGPEFTTTGPRNVTGATTSDIFINFPFPDPSSAYHVLILGVVASGSHTGGIALFTNTSFSGAGQSFSTLFGVDEAPLVADLMTNSGSSQNLINFVFNSGVILTDGFVPGDPLTITAFSNGEVIGSGTSTAVATTPLPTTLPLIATGLGALGLLGWRRKRKAARG